MANIFRLSTCVPTFIKIGVLKLGNVPCKFLFRINKGLRKIFASLLVNNQDLVFLVRLCRRNIRAFLFCIYMAFSRAGNDRLYQLDSLDISRCGVLMVNLGRSVNKCVVCPHLKQVLMFRFGLGYSRDK